jgi:hypothetical protein
MTAAMQNAQLIAVKVFLDRRRQKGEATASLDFPKSRERTS